VVTGLAGQGRGADPIVYLTGLGYALPPRNARVNMQETLYLFMILYEIKTGTDVSNIRIRDFGAMSGVRGIDGRYLRHVQAAYEIGIYDDPQMNPNRTATIGDIITLIHNISGKVNF
jgi:hypothetical protein